MSTTYLFPELESRKVKNGDRIRLSSLRFVQRALQRMWEDSGYWVGKDNVDKTTGENTFSLLSWHIVYATGNTITVKPTDENEDARMRCMFSYSYAGEGGNSRVHGSRFGTVAAGDRLQISFPSTWAIGHNAVIRKVEYAGSNSLKLTLDRATEGIKNSTHSRYKIGDSYEIYHATISDTSYTDSAGATRYTTNTTWALDGALVVTTSRRIMPCKWYAISPRTKSHGCKFCMCDHSNSAALLASTGTAIDSTGRHWYCAKRKYFVEQFVPYPEGESEGGGAYEYTWKSPSAIAKFTPDCHACLDSEGKICDCYSDSYDNGEGPCKDFAFFDEGMHMCRVLDDAWQSVPYYTEMYLQPPALPVFRYECVGTPSLLAQKRIPATLKTCPDSYTTKSTELGKWCVAGITNGTLCLNGGGAFTPCDGWQNPSWGFGPRIKPFEKSGRGGCDFVKGSPVVLHPKKTKKQLASRIIDEVKLTCSDGTGRLFLKQQRLCITVGQQRWTFDSSGGSGFYLPNSMQAIEGETQSFGSEWAGIRKYDNAIISETSEHGKIYFQVYGASAGDGADGPQPWHLVHETYDSELQVWVIDSAQNDVDQAPPISILSGATTEQILLRMRYRDAVVIPISDDRDIDYSVIKKGDLISFERAGM